MINSFEYFLEKKFSLHTCDKKIKMKTLGRPMSDLKLIQVIKKNFVVLYVRLQMTFTQNIIVFFFNKLL